MNNQNGLLTQKPETPVPMVGKLYEYMIIPMKSRTGKPYTKLKNPDERKGENGTPCEVLSVERTDYTDSYGNVSYNIGYQVMQASGNGPQTSQDARRTASNTLAQYDRSPLVHDDRSNRIERQSARRDAVEFHALECSSGGAPSLERIKQLMDIFESWI